MHTALAYDPNEQPWWESRAKPLSNPEAEADSGDPLEKLIRRWLARKSKTVGEKDQKVATDSEVEKEHNEKISDEEHLKSLIHDSVEHLEPRLDEEQKEEEVNTKTKRKEYLQPKLKKAENQEISEELEERSQGRMGEDPEKEMRRYLEMKRDDPNFFGPAGAGKNEIGMGGKEDNEDDKEESSHLGSRRQMVEPDEGDEGESEGVRLSDKMRSKQMKNSDIEEQGLGYDFDEGFPEMQKEFRSQHVSQHNPKSRQQRKKKTNKPGFVRSAPPRSPVKIYLEAADIDDQGHDFEDDEEYGAEMHKQFRS